MNTVTFIHETNNAFVCCPGNISLWTERERQGLEPGQLCTKQCLAAPQRVTGRARTTVH